MHAGTHARTHEMCQHEVDMINTTKQLTDDVYHYTAREFYETEL